MPRRENVLDDRHRTAYVLGSLVALRLVLWECLVAESLAMVESHTEVVGTFFRYHLVKSVDKAHHRTRVHTLGIDSRRSDKGIVGAIDEGVGVEKK